MRRSSWHRITLGCLAALAAPGPASAELFQGSSGFAFARNVEHPATVQIMTGPDSLGVTLGAAASSIIDLADDQWLDDFLYDASALGGGSVTWGSASGNLSLAASSVPRFSQPAPGGASQPATNQDSAQSGGTVYFRFTELGTITSQTLAAGTPVTVDLNCIVQSSGFVSGSLPSPDETRVGASAECRITDNSGFVRTEIFIGGNELETKQLASAVGHELEIEGVFRVTGEAFAGPQICCMGYLGEAQAGIAGSGGLWLGMPAAATVAAASGHDYTVPVPEPSTSSMAVVAVLALGSYRALARAVTARMNSDFASV